MERITTQPGVRLGAVKRMRKPQRSSRAAVYRAVTGSVERPSCRGSVTSFFVGANQSLAPPLLLLTRGRQPTGRTPFYSLRHHARRIRPHRPPRRAHDTRERAAAALGFLELYGCSCLDRARRRLAEALKTAPSVQVKLHFASSSSVLFLRTQ